MYKDCQISGWMPKTPSRGVKYDTNFSTSTSPRPPVKGINRYHGLFVKIEL